MASSSGRAHRVMFSLCLPIAARSWSLAGGRRNSSALRQDLLRRTSETAIRSTSKSWETLEWRTHLAASTPWKAALVVIAVVLASGLAAWLCGGPLPAVGAALVLLNAVGEFLFPVQYRLSPAGAEMRCGLTRRAISWEAVRHAYLQPGGVKLSPLERPDRRERFRGLFIQFNENEEQVKAYLRAALERSRAGSWEQNRVAEKRAAGA